MWSINAGNMQNIQIIIIQSSQHVNSEFYQNNLFNIDLLLLLSQLFNMVFHALIDLIVFWNGFIDQLLKYELFFNDCFFTIV